MNVREKGRVGAWNEEAHKIGRFGLRMKMRSRTAALRAISYILFMTRDLCEDERIYKESVRERNETEKRERDGLKIDKHTSNAPFVMSSYSIYRDRSRDSSLVSEFRVRGKIATLRKNVTCTHTRRRSSKTSRGRVRSRLDSPPGR